VNNIEKVLVLDLGLLLGFDLFSMRSPVQCPLAEALSRFHGEEREGQTGNG
jgi:hypothetical protein